MAASHSFRMRDCSPILSNVPINKINLLPNWKVPLKRALTYFSGEAVELPTVGCPKKNKSPNFVSQLTPLVFIG